MKRFVLVLLFLSMLFSIGCNGVVSNTCEVKFIQDGQVVKSYSIAKGELLSVLDDVPLPIQPLDDTLITEWNYNKSEKCLKDITISTITYTVGLQFLSYYSGIKNIRGYEVGSGYKGNATHIVIPDYYKGLPVIKIGDNAFDGTEEGNYTIKKVTLPKGLIEVGNSAFSYCRALAQVNIPKTVCSVGNRAFYNAPLTGTLELSGEIEDIPTRSFQGTRFNRVILNEGTLEIGAHAFTTRFTISEIILPSSIRKIDAVAFWQQPIEKFFYKGTDIDWHFVEIDESIYPSEAEVDALSTYLEFGETGVKRAWLDKDGNQTSKIVYPKIYFYSENKPTEQGNFWRFVNNEPTVW